MSTSFQPVNTSLVQISSTEELIRRRLEAERVRLEKEYGLQHKQLHHFHKPIERPFTKAERGQTTLLFGGLTWKHEKLVHAAFEGLGYDTEVVPTPDVAAFLLGKEYGNNGQCNPTYFTVGNLVQYLQKLEEKGLSKKEITDRYIFLTAGACGPCRFGMYEAEYRLALRNSGFDGFRVMLFDQSAGIDQSDVEAGFEFNFDFMLSLLNGIFLGDLLNEVAYHVRPYEVVAGRTNQVFEQAVEALGDKLRSKSYGSMQPGALARLLSKLTPVSSDDMAERFLDQLRGDYYTSECRRIAQMIDDEIEVDYTRPRPTCKVTGEFWAQTTEGDGNFNMFPFLEREGAEVLVEPITTWVAYMLHQVICKMQDARGLKEGEPVPGK
ncbi:MAG: hypothetical protein ACRDH5_05130, partial [bacterium]